VIRGEINALRRVFGEKIVRPISSKSATGHFCSALAGCVEAIFSAQARLRSGVFTADLDSAMNQRKK